MNPKAKLIYKKFNSYYASWAFWFFITMVLVHLLATIFAAVEIWSLFDTSRQATQVFMLILGIMNMGLLSYIVSNGITRRDYFTGITASALLYSLLLTVAAAVSTFLLEVLALPALGWQAAVYPEFSFIILLSLFLRYVLFYFIGWFIMAGFYRFHWLIGMLFIGGGILIVSIFDFLVGEENAQMFDFLPVVNLPDLLGIPLIILLIIGTMIAVRSLTKNVRIKI